MLGSEDNHGDPVAFRVICAHRTYGLLGDDGQDVADWIDVIKKCSRAAQARPTLSARPSLRTVSSDEDDDAVASGGIGDDDDDAGGAGVEERGMVRRKKRMLRRTDTALPADEDEEGEDADDDGMQPIGGDAFAVFARGGLRPAGGGASDDESTDNDDSDDGWGSPRSFAHNRQPQHQQQQQGRRRQPKETLASLSQKQGRGARQGWGWGSSKRFGSRRGRRNRFDDDISDDFDTRYDEDPIDVRGSAAKRAWGSGGGRSG